MSAVQVDQIIEPFREELMPRTGLVQCGEHDLGVALQCGQSDLDQDEQDRHGEEEDHVQAALECDGPDDHEFVERLASQGPREVHLRGVCRRGWRADPVVAPEAPGELCGLVERHRQLSAGVMRVGARQYVAVHRTPPRVRAPVLGCQAHHPRLGAQPGVHRGRLAA